MGQTQRDDKMMRQNLRFSQKKAHEVSEGIYAGG